MATIVGIDPLADPNWRFTKTPNGTNYAVRWDNFRIAYAAGASQIVAWLRCRWGDRDKIRKELLGYSQWRSGATYLDRYLPLACPYDPTLRCASLELKQKGCDPDRDTLANPQAGNWINFDWAVFEAIFRRPPYTIIGDDGTIPFGSTNRWEFSRYTTVARQYAVRERRVPGLLFETVLAGTDTKSLMIPEPGFIPDSTQTFFICWHQVPAEAMPDARLTKYLNTVNSVDFPIPLGNFGNFGLGLTPFTATTFTALAGSLLFRGLAQPQEPTPGADGNLYFNPVFIMDYRPTVSNIDAFDNAGNPIAEMNPYGWNGYRLPQDGTYRRLRTKGSGTGTNPGKTPYPTQDHRLLFQPGNQ